MCPPATLKAMAQPALSRARHAEMGLMNKLRRPGRHRAPSRAARLDRPASPHVLDLNISSARIHAALSDEDYAFSIKQVCTHEAATYGNVVSYGSMRHHIWMRRSCDPRLLWTDRAPESGAPAVVVRHTAKAQRTPMPSSCPRNTAYESR